MKRCCARRRGRVPTSCSATGHPFSRLRPLPRTLIADAIASLRAQQTPYTLVFGEEPDTATRQWMAERFPEATVIAIPDSGHFPHVAHPDAFARILVDVSS